MVDGHQSWSRGWGVLKLAALLTNLCRTGSIEGCRDRVDAKTRACIRDNRRERKVQKTRGK